MDNRMSAGGFTLIEVLMAMLVLSVGLLGAIGMFQWADRGQQYGLKGTRALAMMESRLEAKRSTPWMQLLSDDLDHDGVTDVIMRDDGQGDDITAGDGIFTASLDQDHLHLTWTVGLQGTSPLAMVSLATIEARAKFRTAAGQERCVTLRTLRANPVYIGVR